MSSNKKKRKLTYRSHFDIASFFSEKEDVAYFLDYLLLQSLDISKRMEEIGSDKPYPLLYNNKAYSVSLDYQYFIYTLAKWIAKRTDNDEDFINVCNAFAILQSNSREENRTKWKSDKKRFLSILMTEFIGILTNRDKHSDGTSRERKMITRSYPSWTESVVETEYGAYVMNQIIIDKEQASYYLKDYENKVRFVDKYDIEQSAFGTTGVAKYLTKKGLNREYCFTITNANLYNRDDLIQLNFGV